MDLGGQRSAGTELPQGRSLLERGRAPGSLLRVTREHSGSGWWRWAMSLGGWRRICGE